jgi:hypothetical protein
MDRLGKFWWGLSETPPFHVVDRAPKWLRRLLTAFNFS